MSALLRKDALIWGSFEWE